MEPAITFIIPAFDEEERIGSSLRTILAFLSAGTGGAELIVVDDGSRDSTSEIAAKAAGDFPEIDSRVIRYETNRGKGFAVRTGMEASRGRIAVFSDADLSTPITELPKLIDPITNGKFDVTFGSRALDRDLIGVRQPWRREQGGRVFNLFVRALTGLPYWDTQCGFKAFDMKRFRPLLPGFTIDRFGFDVEFLFAARAAGLRTKEVPVRWDHCEGTKVSILRDSLRMFAEIRQIRKNAAKGHYVKNEIREAEHQKKAVEAGAGRRSNDTIDQR